MMFCSNRQLIRTREISTRRQTGAALVVGLILLLAITVMAVSSMNTASLDLIMAGNEQYRSRAFSAGEIAIERALVGGTYNTSQDDPGPGNVATGIGNDLYTYTITRPQSGAVTTPPPGNSMGSFGAVYFRIEATGTSERGSTVDLTQELYQVIKTADGLAHDAGCGTGSTNLDGTTSTC